ncbi:MFS transporter [Yinghuangia seranimata]|uniref:MFS transporter n=1 Tax=Yinghuangia seranimata TaxID=408067 RepID=UPI00248C18ED|nr:MFS transporter [Yinghuangia seranimata]MDI2130176.1 MFS transporter [Yinghuangia seranimata]
MSTAATPANSRPQHGDDSAGTTPTATTPPVNPRRWLALIFIAIAQLMVVVDVTIVNIALPSAQDSLGVSDGAKQWVITAYTLAFGSLLLLGGRIADYTGRKRTFLIGIVGFAGASALGGAAQSFGMLLASRALQGAFGALLAPSALSLLAVNFTEPKERAKAFGVFGAIAGGGSALGMVLGGVLTEYLDWRACFYVNVPIAVIAGVGAYMVLTETRMPGRTRFDIPGVLLVTSGLFAVVYALSEAESKGWGSALVLGLLAAGAVLLAVFVYVESRAERPLLPLPIALNRTRGSAYLAIGLSVIGMFAMFLILTYYFQGVRHYSPLKAGLAFLPMSVAVVVAGGGISARLLPKVPPRALMVPGLLIAACGMFLLSQMTVDSSYAAVVLPAELLLGGGMGLVMAPAMNYATHGVAAKDTGVASAMANTAQQVGGSIGIALLNTIATRATGTYMEDHRAELMKDPSVKFDGVVHGFSVATGWATLILVAAAALVGLLMNTPRPKIAEVGADAPAPAVHVG